MRTRARMRGVIATGWGGLKAKALPDTILQIDQAPHEWLFPRMAAVVHHGGAGTTATGLRAGKPSVVVPFFGDQPFWGMRVPGSKPILLKKLSADNLAKAIIAVTGNKDILRAADDLGRKIRDEDGVGTAVSLIEAHAA